MIRALDSNLVMLGMDHLAQAMVKPYNISDLELTGNMDVIPVLVDAAESLVDRYDPKVRTPQ